MRETTPKYDDANLMYMILRSEEKENLKLNEDD